MGVSNGCVYRVWLEGVASGRGYWVWLVGVASTATGVVPLFNKCNIRIFIYYIILNI